MKHIRFDSHDGSSTSASDRAATEQAFLPSLQPTSGNQAGTTGQPQVSTTPARSLTALLSPEIEDPLSLAPAQYRALLSESQTHFSLLAEQTGNPDFMAAAQRLSEELLLLSEIERHRA